MVKRENISKVAIKDTNEQRTGHKKGLIKC